MKKLNKKGFVLAETLVVAVFVMALFSIIYMNFYPLVGEYDRREFYDDVDSKYQAFWIKRMIQDGMNINSTDLNKDFKNADTFCGKISTKKALCNSLWEKFRVKHVFITKYKLSEFKTKVENGNIGLDSSIRSYVNYLPEFKVDSLNGAKYRIIVEFERTDQDNGIGKSEKYKTYATMEVVK